MALAILFSAYAVFMMFPLYRSLSPQGVPSTDAEWEFKNYEFMGVPGANVPNAPTPVPNALYVYAAVATFAYLVLKAAVRVRAKDGSQPSALVEIIDHTCDALSITFLTLTLAAALRLGVSTETVILFCSVHVEYYFTNWEHIQRGEGDTSSQSFKLTVNEGLLLAIVAYLSNITIAATDAMNDSSLNGSFWRIDVGYLIPDFGRGSLDKCPVSLISKTSDGCFRLNQFLVYVFATVVALHVVLRVRPVRARHLEFENSAELLLAAYKQLLPIASAVTATILWASNSPTELFKRRPHIFFMGIGVVLGNVNIRLMTANLSKQKFSCYPYMLLLLCLSTFISICGGYGYEYDREDPVKTPSEDICLLWFFINSLSNGHRLVSNITSELCRATKSSLVILDPKHNSK